MNLAQPWLPEHLEAAERGMDYLLECVRDEERIQEKQLDGLSAEGEDLDLISISRSRLTGCSFFSCSFEKGEFMDVVFQSCDFSGSNFSDCFFNRCRFLACKGLGTKFSGSSVKHVLIQDCNLEYANFDSCKLEIMHIQDTRLPGASFSQCRVKEVSWDRAELTGASFFKTSMRGMDFTTSLINGLVMSDGFQELQGAVVDLYQAAELAKRLGLVIK